LLARIEMLRLRLAGEGLFDAERKRAIPLLPRLIGVVSSERGAVIQDIRTTILRRFPRPLVLWPVAVQGEGAAAQIAAAIRGFDALPADGPVPRPDVLIVARGGGSLEDLMAFNEEVVLRAVAACSIPLISAVGHETDTTLIDFVSDRRAPTPTAAAELAVPSRAELAADLLQKAARLTGALGRLAQERRLRLQRAERGLPDLPSLVGAARQRLDDRAQRLVLALPNLVKARRAALVAVERHLPAPWQLIEARRNTAALLGQRLRSGLQHSAAARHAVAARILPRLSDAPIRASLREMRSRLAGVAGRLEGVSPEAVLARGYALVFDRKGMPLTSARAIAPRSALRLHFADGDVQATAVAKGPAGQGSLDM
jgi:exodeoxyribonuclease VII large subunit